MFLLLNFGVTLHTLTFLLRQGVLVFVGCEIKSLLQLEQVKLTVCCLSKYQSLQKCRSGVSDDLTVSSQSISPP